MTSTPRGFLKVVLSIIAFELVVALATQALGLFTYPIILSLHALAAVGCLSVYLTIIAKKGTPVRWPKTRWNWRTTPIVIVAFLVIIFELSSIHYHYTGIVAQVNGMNAVTDSSYAYPYYSDEWVGISLTQYSIASHHLPMKNPLDADKPFSNPLVVFYSLAAELLLLFNLNPLTGWAVLALANGLFVCVLVYIVVRGAKGSPFAASVAALSVPLIVNATNVPGIWFFVPFLGSFTVLLIGLALLIHDDGEQDMWWAVGAFAVALILYPPNVLFIAPIVLALILKNKKNSVGIISAGIIAAAIGVGIVFGLLAMTLGVGAAYHQMIAWIVRPNLDGGIPLLRIWNIVPLPLILLAVGGGVVAYKKKMWGLILPTAIGLVMWCIYAFWPQTFVIDYSRVVSMTSLLLVIVAGMAIDPIFKWVQRGHLYIEALVVVCFIIIAATYPLESGWQKLLLVMPTPSGIGELRPDPPVTRYLTPDDVRIFSDIHESYFLAAPWKGLVIGAATGNYPVDSKSSTISIHRLAYADFMAADCATKAALAAAAGVQFVYGTAFVCPHFTKVATSQEYLNLYSFSSY